MAEFVEPVQKKVKVEQESIFESFLLDENNIEQLRISVAALEYGLNNCQIRTLKVIDANARRPILFTKASMFFEQTGEKYFFRRVFSKAHLILSKYVGSTGDCLNLPHDTESRSALALLLQYFQEQLEKGNYV